MRVVLMYSVLPVCALRYSVNYCSAAIAPRNPYKPRRRVRKHTADSSIDTAVDKAAVPGYPYIAAVTHNAAFIDTDPTGVIQQQQQQQREQRKMSDSVTATASSQQQQQRDSSSSTVHPVQFVVGLTLLLPIVLVQGVLLMVPLRLAAALNQRNSNSSSSNSSSSKKEEQQQQHSSDSSSATGGASPRHSDSPTTTAAAASDAVSADAVLLSTTTTTAAATTSTAAGDSSTSDSQQAETVQQQEAADALPRRIRANFAASGLRMQRVDVMLPAANTHGAIIVRRSFYKNSGGQDVVRHIATAVLHLGDSSEKSDSPTATSPATSVEGLSVASVALEVVEATAEGVVGA
jgi:hypothetical protein